MSEPSSRQRFICRRCRLPVGDDDGGTEIAAVIHVAVDERLDEQLTCQLPRSTLDFAAQAVAQTVGLFVGNIAADQDIRWPDLLP